MEKRLEADDHIQKCYECNLNEKFGYIAISNKKVMFAREKGVLRKTVDFDLDIPTEEIESINHMSDHVFNISEKSGRRHVFKTYDVGVKIIEDLLREQIA